MARVHFGQVISSVCTELQSKEPMTEARCRAEFKFPGRQKIHTSKEWGSTEFHADEFEDMAAEPRLIPDGVKSIPIVAPGQIAGPVTLTKVLVLPPPQHFRQ